MLSVDKSSKLLTMRGRAGQMSSESLVGIRELEESSSLPSGSRVGGGCHADGGEEMNNRGTRSYEYDYSMWLGAARIANQNSLVRLSAEALTWNQILCVEREGGTGEG